MASSARASLRRARRKVRVKDYGKRGKARVKVGTIALGTSMAIRIGTGTTTE